MRFKVILPAGEPKGPPPNVLEAMKPGQAARVFRAGTFQGECWVLIRCEPGFFKVDNSAWISVNEACACYYADKVLPEGTEILLKL